MAPSVEQFSHVVNNHFATNHLKVDTITGPETSSSFISLIDNDTDAFGSVSVGFANHRGSNVRFVTTIQSIRSNEDAETISFVFPIRQHLTPLLSRWDPFAYGEGSDLACKRLDMGARWGMKLHSIVVEWDDQGGRFPMTDRWEYKLKLRYQREDGPDWDLIVREMRILGPVQRSRTDLAARVDIHDVS